MMQQNKHCTEILYLFLSEKTKERIPRKLRQADGRADQNL